MNRADLTAIRAPFGWVPVDGFGVPAWYCASETKTIAWKRATREHLMSEAQLKRHGWTVQKCIVQEGTNHDEV